MERVYNFSAGPSMMPVEILQQAKEDLISYPGRRVQRDGNEPSLCRF